VVGPQTHCTVDELSDDVRMAHVPVGLGDHVHEDPVQGDLTARSFPPGHLSRSVQRQRLDGLVRVCASTAIHPDDLIPRLRSGRPHVPVRFVVGVVGPRPGLVDRPSESRAEVAELHEGEVFHQPEEIRAGRRHRTADVVLGQALQLPEQSVAPRLEVPLEVGLQLG
jgi:hypothetical protein